MDKQYNRSSAGTANTTTTNASDQNQGNFLLGLNAISDYYGRSIEIIKRLIRDDKFPAAKVQGRWESHTSLVDAYRLRRINDLCGLGKN